MKTSTRLILLLTIAVGVLMAVSGYVRMRQREAILTTAMHNEVRAHALTLQIVLEDNYRAGRTTDAQRLIDRLSENPKIYSVILFDEEGQVAILSDPLVADEIRDPPGVARVIASGETAEFVRQIGGEEVFSILMPIRVSPARRGAVEISQPMSFVKADIARARRDIAIITLLLFVTIFLVVLAVTSRSLARPIRELLGGARALGHGELDYRVIVSHGGSELAELARAFNRMADSLAEQRRRAAREAEERLGLERELRHSERLASVGRLAAGVAHEMGAPLNVIDARAEQLLARPDSPPAVRQRNLTIIRAQAGRITRIVRELLNLARPYELHRRPLDLAHLVGGTLELVEPDAARASVKVEVGLKEGVRVEADQELVRQVLLNICLNGIQAMASGGRLRIEAVEGAGAKDGRQFAAVRVSDTGPGIAPEHLAHIFDPFYTTKEIGKGTGLGLSVSRRIVEEHGGWIEAGNNPSGGATFTVYLPKSKDLNEGAPPGHQEIEVNDRSAARSAGGQPRHRGEPSLTSQAEN
jgi:signal transduction histidine kinase